MRCLEQNIGIYRETLTEMCWFLTWNNVRVFNSWHFFGNSVIKLDLLYYFEMDARSLRIYNITGL